MNKIIAFIIVAVVAGLGYWSYNSSVAVIPVEKKDTVVTPEVSGTETEIDSIDLGDNSDSSLQEIDSDLNNL
jgi:hypothetical protein